MTQTTLSEPAVANKFCATCPFFKDFQESNGRGWCNCFNHYARKHHEMTQECVLNGALKVVLQGRSYQPCKTTLLNVEENKALVSHELEDNLSFFPQVKFDELELDAFPTREIEDEADLPHSAFQVGSIVKVIDPDEDHTEWGVFEVVGVRPNISLYKDVESYLQGSSWHYLLSSRDTAQKLDGVWVREDEICRYDESHLICTEDIF